MDSIFKDPLFEANAGIFECIESFDPSRPTALIYAACHGRTLAAFLQMRQDFMSRYNLVRLETGPMLLAERAGSDVFGSKAVREVFGKADLLLTYNMGARHGKLSLENLRSLFKKETEVITFVAPNCSCFWPWAYGYEADIGVLHLVNKGKTEEEIWETFIHGDFDPFFAIRWRTELGRLKDKEAYHDIGIADFVIRHYRKTKMWMSAGHPSFIVMAYIGSRIMAKLGFWSESEEHIASLDYSYAIIGGQPETKYEFDHYKFEYPMRHGGGEAYYREVLSHLVPNIKAGSLTPVPWD